MAEPPTNADIWALWILGWAVLASVAWADQGYIAGAALAGVAALLTAVSLAVHRNVQIQRGSAGD